MAEHTPTPWASSKQWLYGPRGYVLPIASGFLEFVTNPGGSGHDEAVANAALIVRAVNSHDALVKALNGMVEMYADMVNSGDCGFWDPEKVKEVIAARGALSLASQRCAPGSDAQSLETREVQS